MSAARLPSPGCRRPDRDRVIGQLARSGCARATSARCPVFFALIADRDLLPAEEQRTSCRPGNFNNLIVQMAGEALIAMGVVFVLLLGEIDLSIGFVERHRRRARRRVRAAGRPLLAARRSSVGSLPRSEAIAIAIAVWCGALIGFAPGRLRRHHRRALVRRDARRPADLAGRAARDHRRRRHRRDPGRDDQRHGQLLLRSPVYGWILAAIAIARTRGRRRAHASVRRGTRSACGTRSEAAHGLVVVRIVAWSRCVTFFIGGVCTTTAASRSSGVILVFLLVVWTYVSDRTVFGRHVYAVGGNAEAARRAGINVTRIRILVFMISSAHGRRRRHHPRLAPRARSRPTPAAARCCSTSSRPRSSAARASSAAAATCAARCSARS